MSARVKVYLNGTLVPEGATLTTLRGTLQITQQTGVSTANFTLRTFDRSERPVIGTDVVVDELRSGSTYDRVFAGRIISAQEDVRPETDWRDHVVTCTDYTWATRKRNAGERTFTDEHRNNIIRTLNTEALDGEGFSVAEIPVDDGGVIKELKLVFSTVAQAFDQLASLTDSIWYIDYFSQIKFVPAIQPTARFVIDDSYHDILHPRVGRGALVLEETIEDTANRIIVRFGKTEQAVTTETFDSASDQDPDGSRQSWQLASEVARVPTIRVNTIEKTVGIDNVDTGKDWYWSEGSKQINQDAAATPLSSSDELSVEYAGLAYSALQRSDSGHIATYGVLDKLVDISAVTTGAASEEIADALIDQLAQNSYVLTWATKLHGNLAPQVGDRIDLNRTGYPSLTNLVVKSVSLSPSGEAPEWFWRKVTATRGPKLKDGQSLLSSGTVSGSAASGSSFGGGGGGSSSTPWFGVTYASTVDIAKSNGSKQYVALTGNVILTASGWADGDDLLLLIVQSTGGHTATFSTGFKVPPGQDIDGDPFGETYFQMTQIITGVMVATAIQRYD